MCDTVIVTAEASADGVAIFGKNSDREPNEAHHLEQVPAGDYPAGSMLKLTYVEIPQVAHTYGVLLAKPFWIWGAEMGANEHGVVIGNEAVFTRVPYHKAPGVIGMDLLRLGLERGATARQALEVITALLEEHGQGGNCGFAHSLYYHNSFIIADPGDAWVLETVNRQWAAKQVSGVYTISNGITLRNEWDLASTDLVRYAVDRGWCKNRDDFDFAACYSDTIFTRFSDCRHRCSRTTGLLDNQRGRINVRTVMSTLRDHGESDRSPEAGLTGAEVCMHAGLGPVRVSQSIGSMVSYLHPDRLTHFFTATAAPCTSVFKPAWLDARLPDTGPKPTGVDDPETLFWQHERLHRLTLEDYPARIALYQGERNALEKRFVEEALAQSTAEPGARGEFSQRCFNEAAAAEADWLERVRERPARGGGWLHRQAWKGFNRQAGLDLYV